jgi:hypothetical protein
MNRFPRIFPAALLLAIAVGCSPQGPPRTPTYPVTGQVLVDGQPAADLAVFFTNVNGVDKNEPTYSTANTDADGRFKVSTYESGDGIPEGTYSVTFMWGQVNLMTMSYGGPDKLNGRYSDAATSQFKVTVKRGEPADMGKLTLSTSDMGK